MTDSETKEILTFMGTLLGISLIIPAISLFRISRIENQIDEIRAEIDCIPYEISQQLNKPYTKGISLACLEEVK